VNKEQVYDEQIHGLVKQILAICKENQIPMVASFHIPNPEDADLMCTSALLYEEWETPQSIREAYRLVFHGSGHQSMAITITKGQ
jgi:UV DNA damage repair endonuclease